MAINTTAIANLLRPGLAAVFGSYNMYPSMWSEIYDTYESDKAEEIEVQMKMTGLAAIRAEGAPTSQDTMGQRIITQYVHQYVGLSFAITNQAMADNLYESSFPLMAKSLKHSLAQTKEILGAAILNNGFNAAYPIGDGQPLFSMAHPIDGGTVSNYVTPAPLTEDSLQQAIIQIQQFRDQAGLLIQVKPMKLLVPPANTWAGTRLLESAFRTNTANNDISAIYNLSAIPGGLRVNQFLTNPNSWFILNDVSNGFKYYSRQKVETDVYTDFMTDNLLCKAIERYSFGVSDFRAAWGSQG